MFVDIQSFRWENYGAKFKEKERLSRMQWDDTEGWRIPLLSTVRMVEQTGTRRIEEAKAMSIEYLSIGQGPSDEECAQVGMPRYSERAKAEILTFKNLIMRTLGEPPEGALLTIKTCPHDLGTYFELVCVFEDDNEAGQNYAILCESNAPSKWDKAAESELQFHQIQADKGRRFS